MVLRPEGCGMRQVALIGAGFVADLYMRSFMLHPETRIIGVHDRDPTRLAAFTAHWDLPGFDSREALFAALEPGSVILNLTNPSEHFAVSEAALNAGHHVFCEKPLTMSMEEAQALDKIARARGLHLASAPSSVLGEAAQTMGQALRKGTIGTPKLVYGELDDGYIRQAPYQDWQSESGAPWPAQDEFAVGCTLEHAGYYLSWLIAWFGPVQRVTSTASCQVGEEGHAPDVSVAVLDFASGLTARLTCSIIASHDHRLRVFTDKGVLKLEEAWNNAAPVRFHRRVTLRRRLMEHPLGKRLRLSGPTHPKVKRFGAAAMNFALGPVEMCEALDAGHVPRLAGDYALHLTEVTLATQSGETREMTTSCAAMEPMPWAL
jgi:predicted dehydrogenase